MFIYVGSISLIGLKKKHIRGFPGDVFGHSVCRPAMQLPDQAEELLEAQPITAESAAFYGSSPG